MYVTNYSDENVKITDGATNTLIASIAVGDGAWGVAVNPNTNRTYVTNYWDGNVKVISCDFILDDLTREEVDISENSAQAIASRPPAVAVFARPSFRLAMSLDVSYLCLRYQTITRQLACQLRQAVIG